MTITRPALYILFALIAISNAGCDNTLVSFVYMNRPGELIPFEGSSSVKISPGHTVSTSSDVSMKVHVTITDRLITGNQVAAKVSMSRSTKLE